MAIIATNRLAEGFNNDAASYVSTASITPGANSLMLVAVLNSKAALPDQASLSGCGLTWVQIDSILFSTIALGTRRLSLFRAMGTSPSTGPLTVTFALSQTSCILVADELTGTDTSGTDGSGAIVQSANNFVDAATSLTVTLAAFASAENATYGTAGTNQSTATTAGTGFTELASVNATAPTSREQTQWRVDNDTTVDWSAGGSRDWAGIAVEVKSAPPAQTISGAGNIASAAGIGALAAHLAVALTGLASAEQIGIGALNLALLAAGVGSEETVSAPTVTVGTTDQTIAPAGLVSAEQLGVLAMLHEIIATGIPTAELIGQLEVGLQVAVTGLASAEQIGMPTLVLPLEILPAGLTSSEAIGAAAIVPTGLFVEGVELVWRVGARGRIWTAVSRPHAWLPNNYE